MDPANLRAVPIFAQMSEEDLRRIATFASEDSVAQGTTLVREGDYAEDMIAIESGTADVVAAGDVFGEIGVLSRELRSASVVATSPMRLIRMTAFDLKRLPPETRVQLAEVAAARRTRDGDAADSGPTG
jgi:CRP-like cAMP-binding protein